MMKSLQELIWEIRCRNEEEYEDFSQRNLSIPSVFMSNAGKPVFLVVGYETSPYDGAIHPNTFNVGLFDIDSGNLIKSIGLDDAFEGNAHLYNQYETFLERMLPSPDDKIAADIDKVVDSYLQKTDQSTVRKQMVAKYLLLQSLPTILQIQMALCPDYFTYLIEE